MWCATPNARCWWCGTNVVHASNGGGPREELVAEVVVRNPVGLRDALWEVLVVQFADFLSRLTLRRVLEFVAIAFLAIAFAQTFPIDLAFLFAGDTLTYLEIVVIVRLAAGRQHFQEMLRIAARLARFAMRVLRAAISQPVSRINWLRERRNPARPAKPRSISNKTDDGRGFGATWGALATP